MIDFHTFGTPNGRKVAIMLEETGLPYTAHVVDIRKGDQFKPEFLAVNPNGKIPAIVDRDGPDGAPLAVFESGAILMYLAEKVGSPLLPTATRARYAVIEWLMFQMAGVGPMLGQVHHFFQFAPEDVPYAKTRYGTEAKRLYGVMDRRLGETAHLAGAEFSIADIATYPWVDRHQAQQIDLAEFPNVRRWFDAISTRPAVRRGMKVPA